MCRVEGCGGVFVDVCGCVSKFCTSKICTYGMACMLILILILV